MLETLIEPAVEALDPTMDVIRADKLPSSPITASVFEHVTRSRLVIADLSFHNANVLHEVGVRHGRGRPCVLISRTDDPIPANLHDVRVVLVNTSEIWRFVKELDTRRDEIVAHARWALSSEGGDSSPVQRLT